MVPLLNKPYHTGGVIFAMKVEVVVEPSMNVLKLVCRHLCSVGEGCLTEIISIVEREAFELSGEASGAVATFV